MRTLKLALIPILFAACTLAAQSKPKLTFDEFFNSVDITSVEMSPDANSVVIGTSRADWDQQIYRDDLWLFQDDPKGGSLIQLTQSGHDSEPKWSPDGKWIAFLSDRKTSSGKNDDEADSDSKDEGTSQIFVISPHGGEAIALTQGEEEVHTFSWSADSQTIYYATRQPWTKSQKDDYKQLWKDVIQYRTAERGDTIFALDLAAALARHEIAPAKVEKKEGEPEEQPDLTPGARVLATIPLRVEDLITSPNGQRLAFATNAINQRQEKYEDREIFVLELDAARSSSSAPANESKPTQPRQLTHNQAEEGHLRWARDNRHIFFMVEVGDVSGPYRDLQPHLYWVDADKPDSDKPDSQTGSASDLPKIDQWGQDFPGQVVSYVPYGNGALITARLGTEVQIYTAANPRDSFHSAAGNRGTYETLSNEPRSVRVAFTYSSLTQPSEVYLAAAPDKLAEARAITSFNKLFAERDLPQGKPYQWKADDGTTVEGMLIFPPGIAPDSPAAKHLPMFTFIHGGPADADGNHFEADWYQWADLAATNGWLVFEPNYRGSTGYGDKFLMQIVPQIVSRPGKDILEGVDALVKDGIADPDHLVVGGYSYGGYMTNWLITQTTRFKAAVTGAGAVEHVGNWGNDDTTYDDAYFLGGRPWEAAQRYHDEAAIFQIDKVKTPTHMVAGADDIRVAVLEDYLLEHALYSLGIPNALLIFPGEGHSLTKNPWHGKIKVREELKWLQKYAGVPASN
ncbi:MAG TPA: prolyl oligopeptidase family serine peptidase [Candidatus Sulfotelmatobacter sp.]|nr:prolyl oligopeptidase family serine peptidase [Candidatus Sulfotelmatobacter sp.]